MPLQRGVVTFVHRRWREAAMLILRGVEEKHRNELTLNARLGRQDKSNGAMRRLSRCLHIQDLALAVDVMSPKPSRMLRYFPSSDALIRVAFPKAFCHRTL